MPQYKRKQGQLWSHKKLGPGTFFNITSFSYFGQSQYLWLSSFGKFVWGRISIGAVRFSLTTPYDNVGSVRAKSRLHDTITQTWYYHVCVILCITET